MRLFTTNLMTDIDTRGYVVRRIERIKPTKLVPTNAPSSSGIELNDIRRELGCTVAEFARLLNTSKGTLSSYMYGIVQNVPESILKEARLLRHQAGNALQAASAKFDNISMREISDAWMKSLGIDDSKSRETLLAETLKIDRATVWRWRERDMRPDPRRLKAYDDVVIAVAASKKQH